MTAPRSLVLVRARETEPVVPDKRSWCTAYSHIGVVAVTGDRTTMLGSPHPETLRNRFTEVPLRAFPAGA